MRILAWGSIRRLNTGTRRSFWSNRDALEHLLGGSSCLCGILANGTTLLWNNPPCHLESCPIHPCQHRRLRSAPLKGTQDGNVVRKNACSTSLIPLKFLPQVFPFSRSSTDARIPVECKSHQPWTFDPCQDFASLP